MRTEYINKIFKGTVQLDGALSGSSVDTDGTLAANSDTVVPSQKAVKTYVGTISTSVYSAKSASYVITDIDTIRTVGMTTGASDYTVTLPTAADNTDRIIAVKKVDSGVGKVTVLSDAAAETIDGVSGATGIEILNQFDGIEVQCDGSDWHVISNFNTAKDDALGLVKKNKYETKYLSSDITSDGAMSDLTMSNLVVGRTYRATLHAAAILTSDGNVLANIVHNSATISQFRLGDGATGTTQAVTATIEKIFVAAATTCTFEASSASAAGSILGDGTSSETYATLEELNNYEVTTDF